MILSHSNYNNPPTTITAKYITHIYLYATVVRYPQLVKREAIILRPKSVDGCAYRCPGGCARLGSSTSRRSAAKGRSSKVRRAGSTLLRHRTMGTHPSQARVFVDTYRSAPVDCTADDEDDNPVKWATELIAGSVLPFKVFVEYLRRK
ncbi:hypothetical protein QE152_g27643 [Popillia japonica]|uniref:Uncharacterized protein n=1 Tax=Popillia japonica TaxID=7064 RepID=A0AAW1JR86_POPJA